MNALLSRNIVPEGYTTSQWQEILLQADEWGRILEYSFPGTVYDPEKLRWDFSKNEQAKKTFPGQTTYIFTPTLAALC